MRGNLEKAYFCMAKRRWNGGRGYSENSMLKNGNKSYIMDWVKIETEFEKKRES